MAVSHIVKAVSQTQESVVEIAAWLIAMMAPLSSSHGKNGECCLAHKYKRLFREMQTDIPSIVNGLIDPNDKEYMAAQREKTGLVMQDDKAGRRYWKWPSYRAMRRRTIVLDYDESL